MQQVAKSPAISLIGPVGLEPTTYGLEIRCSVQLSYEPVNNTSTTSDDLESILTSTVPVGNSVLLQCSDSGKSDAFPYMVVLRRLPN